MIRNCLWFILSLVSLNSFSGNVDSLYKKILYDKNDTVKAKSRYALASYYLYNKYEYKMVLRHCDTLIEFCNQKKFHRLAAKAHIFKAYSNEYLGNYDLAIKCDSAALLIAKQKKYPDEEVNAIQNMGNNFAHKGNYAKALEYFLITLKLDEEKGDVKAAATMYHNCAIVYRKNGQKEKALEFFRKAAAIRQATNDPQLASTLCSIGNYFLESKTQVDSGLIYYEKALQISITNSLTATTAMIQQNMGAYYINNKQYKKAEKYFLDNLAINEKFEDKDGIAAANNVLSALYAHMGNKKLAFECAQKGLNISKEIKNPEQVREAYRTLSEISAMFKEFENAFKYQTLEIQMRDSLNKEGSSKLLVEMGQKYESEKKEKEIELLQEKSTIQELTIKNNHLFIYGGVALVLLLVIVAFILIRSNRSKLQANKLLTDQNHIIEDKNKEITDSIKYAKRIQNTILPSLDLVTKYFPESFIYFLPKDIVSGDFYYFHRMELEGGKQKIIVAAVDCTGHGVPGALVSVIGYNALNSTIKEFKVTEPGMILDKVRELVLETFNASGSEVKDGMDMSLLMIDLDHKNKINAVKWAGANNPLWIHRKQSAEIEEYKGNKQPIGITEILKPFTTHQIEINTGDRLFIFTDGYADQFGGKAGKKLKSGNMKKVILNSQNLSMTDQKNEIEIEFNDWRKDLEQVDDVCVIGIKI